MRGVIGILLITLLCGCSGTFQAKKTTPVSSIEVVGGYATLEPEVGILYEYFTSYKAFSEHEAKESLDAYQGMLRSIRKLQRKTTAGKVDYHRLLYFAEDFTEYWEDLRPILNVHADVPLFDDNSIEAKYEKACNSLWFRVRGDVDVMLEAINIRLRAAEGAMDKASYEQFRRDAQGLIKTISPLFEKGVDLIL